MTNQDDDRFDPTIDSDKAGENHGSQPGFSAVPSRIPKQIGNYRIKQLIGSGGMGSVYLALQEQPRRTVALKLMKAGIASNSALRRFEYESQLLARLSHPGIAEVYDAGTHETPDGGVPYFVMEYISGARRITDYVREKNLSNKQRLELLLEVCAAIHHGHTKGVIHRDLKPDNILVDSHGRVKIIDFGVARATDSDMAAATMQTDIGQLVGTVQYMSPEQMEADPNDLDTRSDVYALGVVLYELLCEQLPYDVTNVKLFDATRIVREQEAKRLSTINSSLKGDVETIVLKALEKDRDRRYQSAENLAADIQRYLNAEPIMARPPSLTYQVRVFARRNKALMTGVAAVFCALLLGLAGMSWLYVDTVRARNAKAAALEVAVEKTIALAEQRKIAVQAQEDAEKANKKTQEAFDEVRAKNEEVNRNLYYAEMDLAKQVMGAKGGRSRATALIESKIPAAGQTDYRGWEWYYLYGQLFPESLIQSDTHPWLKARWGPDGLRLFKGNGDNKLTVHDAATGVLLNTLSVAESVRLRGNVLNRTVQENPMPSHDGKRLAWVDGDSRIHIANVMTDAQISTIAGHEGGGG